MKKYLLEIDGKKYEVEVDLSGPNPSVLVNGKKIDVTIDNSNNLEKEKLLSNNLKGVFELKSYFLKIASFGGRINTLFFYFRGLLIEYVKKLV